MSYPTASFSGLPDPASQSDFYSDVAFKRGLAWVIDITLVSIITALIVVLTAFTALFFLAFVFMLVDFLYRWISLSRKSATPGMRLVALEFRKFTGDRLDSMTALFHTLGYFASWSFGLPQLLSVLTIIFSPKRQSLTDMVLGTASLNRASLH